MDTRIERQRHNWRGLLRVATMLVAAVVANPASAVESVGRVIIASGDVTVVRPGASARSIERGDRIYEGDEIRTGRRGNAQIRFVDGALFDLDPDTRFAVDRYRAGGGQSAGSALLSFLSGALRTITGAIGRGSDDLYRMRTPTATIGVRGTGYSLYYCDANCA
ncbi:MAG: FecR family protein, partial [Halofilum sp. (in: g-proteobacteria)]|nr:FecR family protein [Halofilum sp. (in: g-proteobacteria)]